MYAYISPSYSHIQRSTFRKQGLALFGVLCRQWFDDKFPEISLFKQLKFNLNKSWTSAFFPATERYYCYMLEPFLDPIVFVVSFWWKHLFSTKTKQGKTMVCGKVCTSTGQREITAARSGMEPAGVVVIWCLWWIVFSRLLITAPCNRVCLYTSLLLCQCFPFYIVQW